MKKIPNLFARDDKGNLTTTINPLAQWVVDGEGYATRKWDGTACMLRGGVIYKRYDCKRGKTPPAGFEPCQEHDAVTGHWPGWVPVGEGPEDRWLREARGTYDLPDGTYEACGPKINGNPEGLPTHGLIRHGAERLGPVPRDWIGLIGHLTPLDIEGIVWHHPDGRMVKVRKHDLGLKRKPERVGQES